VIGKFRFGPAWGPDFGGYVGVDYLNEHAKLSCYITQLCSGTYNIMDLITGFSKLREGVYKDRWPDIIGSTAQKLD
jgi:hypothetical protein